MTDQDNLPAYKALALLETDCAPKKRGRNPLWRIKPPAVSGRIRVPAWDWTSDTKAAAGDLVTLDVNAAWLSAAAGVTVAFGQLERLRPDADSLERLLPGYYLIDAHPWPGPGICSPLGTAEMRGRVWVAHPTVQLLRQLEADGYWPGVTAHDAHVCPDGVRLTKWTDRVRDDRRHALEYRDLAGPDSAGGKTAAATYEAIKVGYASAVEMMLTGKKSRTHRPDWAHAIVAQHAANTWRKAWRGLLAGHGPARMGAVDEITYTYDDFLAIGALPEGQRPFRIDQTGVALGSLKIKSWDPATPPVADDADTE